MDLLDILLGAKFGGRGSGGSSSFIPSFGTIASVDLGTTWSGNDPYTSTVTVTGYTVTDKTMVSVLPSTAVLTQMLSDGTTNIFITNNNGVLTATAHGAAPTYAMTLTVLCTESDLAADIGNLPAIVGDGVIETLQANDLTDAVNQLGDDVSDVKNAIEQKQDAPSSAGTAGQVLGLNNSLQPAWVNQSGGGDVSNCAPIIINTASGDIATFADGADNRQIRKIVGTIVTPEGGSGYSGCKFILQNSNDAITVISTLYNGQITSNGVYSENAPKRVTNVTSALGSTLLLQAGIYVVSIDGLDSISLLTKDSNGNIIDNFAGSWNALPFTFTLTQPGYFYMTGRKTANVDLTPSDYTVQIDMVQTLVVNWQSEAGTVYNGTVTLNEDKSVDVFASETGITTHIANVGYLMTALGTNKIWIDTGTITECDYPADTKLYVDGLTAPDEDMIADGLIASGKYFTVNNQLYLSTAQIAAGAQIIPGSNCTATSIPEALNALNA